MSFTINLESEDGAILDSIEDFNLLKNYIPDISNKNFYCLKYVTLQMEYIRHREILHMI